MNRSEDSVTHDVVVPVSPEDAFYFFAHELGAWWPEEYTWAKEDLDTIGMEPFEGGRCFERGPHGFTCDWGRVLAWNPPSKLSLQWQISPSREPVPDPKQSSIVHVDFSEAGKDRTRVSLGHRDFANHGKGHAEYRAAMASEYGWPYILAQYQRHVESYAQQST